MVEILYRLERTFTDKYGLINKVRNRPLMSVNLRFNTPLSNTPHALACRATLEVRELGAM